MCAKLQYTQVGSLVKSISKQTVSHGVELLSLKKKKFSLKIPWICKDNLVGPCGQGWHVEREENRMSPASQPGDTRRGDTKPVQSLALSMSPLLCTNSGQLTASENKQWKFIWRQKGCGKSELMSCEVWRNWRNKEKESNRTLCVLGLQMEKEEDNCSFFKHWS